MKYFDCNCNYGRTGLPPHRFAATPAELRDEMDFGGIDAALVFHTNQRFASPVAWNPAVVADIGDDRRLVPTWAILPRGMRRASAAGGLLTKWRTTAYVQSGHSRRNTVTAWTATRFRNCFA